MMMTTREITTLPSPSVRQDLGKPVNTYLSKYFPTFVHIKLLPNSNIGQSVNEKINVVVRPTNFAKSVQLHGLSHKSRTFNKIILSKHLLLWRKLLAPLISRFVHREQLFKVGEYNEGLSYLNSYHYADLSSGTSEACRDTVKKWESFYPIYVNAPFQLLSCNVDCFCGLCASHICLY